MPSFVSFSHQINSDLTTPFYSQKVDDAILDDSPQPLNTLFTLIELENGLHNLSSKAFGVDRIHNEMLMNLSDQNRVSESEYQTGLRKGCSTTYNIICLETAIKMNFNHQKITFAVFLDISKAYNSTCTF